MISCIICSRTPNISSELYDNIASTIGCDYELVVIDNSMDNYSIFSAYNEGVKRAKGDIVCYVHQDVRFESINWGTIIKSHFTNKDIGIIGFGGAHFLPDSPCYWYSSPFISQYSKQDSIFHSDLEWFDEGNPLVDVVACDGFCMFIRSDLFNRIAWDTKTYQGFHMYDMDICMQTLQIGFRVCVCRDIVVNHFWKENTSVECLNSFNNNLVLFSHKWHSLFPISRGIEMIPERTLSVCNSLFKKQYEGIIAQNSFAYKIGSLILYPIKLCPKIPLFHS